MQLQPFNLVGGYYRDDSLPWSAQDVVNWIPEVAEAQGTRTGEMLRDAPGLRQLVMVGEGPIRGLRNVEGKLLCVSGNTLYQISNSGVAIPRGTIPGTGPVSMAHNQTSGVNQVLIANGSAGYVYNTGTLALVKVTDAGYPGAFVVDFIDGYLAQIEPLRRFWFHSGLLNALDYNTLDRYPAEGQPDALVTLIVDHREVWVFGERTIEVFVNTGAETNTFARASNTVIEHGCSARLSPAKLDNSILWLDELGIVRQSSGYTATRVSTGPIEKAIAALDWSRAFSYTFTDRGHAIYYLTFPDGQTFGYDIVTRLWHRRQSYGVDRWRPSCMAYWNDQYIAGDYQQGILYVVDWDYPFDGVLPHVRSRVTGVTHGNQQRVAIPYMELIAEAGGPLYGETEAPPQPDGPMISGDAPNGSVGGAYTYTYTFSGGTGGLVVSLAPGSNPLPDGLTLSAAGVLSGTPTTEASYSFTVRVTDANGLFDDLGDTVAIGPAITAAWFFGPAYENGAGGGSSAFYLRTEDPADWGSKTPIALPNAMGGLGRISTANGRVFFHANDLSSFGQVSSDAGATWTTCDSRLYATGVPALDVYWNGNYYYWYNVRSADGITWSAIPNLPGGTISAWFARDSDGLFLVGIGSNIHITLDDGATAFTQRTNPFSGGSFGPFESNGSRILGAAGGGIGSGYSDNIFATAAVATGTGPGSSKKYSAGAWLGVRLELTRSTDGASFTVVQNVVTTGTSARFIDADDALFAFADKPNTDTALIYTSTDAGANWTAGDTLDGTGTSIAFARTA